MVISCKDIDIFFCAYIYIRIWIQNHLLKQLNPLLFELIIISKDINSFMFENKYSQNYDIKISEKVKWTYTKIVKISGTFY